MSAKKSVDSFTFFVKQCINTCISIAKVLLRLPQAASLPAVKEESCIVLGNGPSLKKSLEEHPDFFRKHPLFCVNSFAVTKEYTELKPSYYVILDPGFFKDSGKHVMDTVEALKMKTTWPLLLLLPQTAKKAVLFAELNKQNSNINIVYFNYTVFRGFSGIAHFFYKRNMAMVQSQNIIAATLFLGINMGFKNIYLFGADHSWHEQLYVNEENILCLKNVHFYDEKEKLSYVPFYKGLHVKETFRMDEILVTFAKAFTGYIALNEYAQKRNCKIYNASDPSFIDAFTRIKL